ncbi:MAG: response regulator [Deltaproteobacteria bacterium]|nr:response regulator [Deltaproteobacteria bacterium]
MQILIADDEQISRRMLETHLVKWGYDVLVAMDGSQAWYILQKPDAPHMAVLDWMMPGLDGVELCRRIRQLPGGSLTHIIILTSRKAQEDIVAGFEAGADDFIAKRINTEELRARIRVGERMIELRQALAGRINELEQALKHIRRLQGILPICMHCHKIRDDREIWQRLEEYIAEHTEAMLSHSLCPDCMRTHYPQFASSRHTNDTPNS